MFKEYHDVVSVDQVAEMLNIGKSSAYSLLHRNQIRCFRVGRKYIVPKQAVIDFLGGACYNEDKIINGGLNKQSSKGV